MCIFSATHSLVQRSRTLVKGVKVCLMQVIVRRGEPIPEGTGPIIVATRNDDLESVITSTPTERQSGV